MTVSRYWGWIGWITFIGMIMIYKYMAALILLFISTGSWSSTTAEFGHYRNLLLSGKTDQLEKEQKKINDGYIQKHVSWSEFYPAFDSLWYERDFKEGTLQEPISILENNINKTGYTYLNLGVYYYEKGRKTRGGKWLNETPQNNLDRMWKYYQVSEGYLKKALEVDLSLVQAYRTLMNIYTNLAEERGEPLIRAYLAKALDVRSDNYVIGHVVLHSQKPRWGGSYAQMNMFMGEIESHFKENKADYGMLKGVIPADQADILLRNKRLNDASEIIGNNEITGYPLLYLEKMELSNTQKDYSTCIEAAEYVLRYYPYEVPALKSLGTCSEKMNAWEKSKNAFYKYTQIKGNAAWQLFYLGKAHMNLHQYDKAYPLLKESVSLKADYIKYAGKMIDYIEKAHPNMTKLSLSDVGL